MRIPLRIAVSSFIACSVVVACAPATAPSSRTTTTAASAAETNKTKCGSCHAPFDPQERTRAELDPILAKHRSESRVALSDGEWNELAAYLAKK